MQQAWWQVIITRKKNEEFFLSSWLMPLAWEIWAWVATDVLWSWRAQFWRSCTWARRAEVLPGGGRVLASPDVPGFSRVIRSLDLSQPAWVQMIAALLPSSVTLSKLLNLFCAKLFSALKANSNKNDDGMSHRELWELKLLYVNLLGDYLVYNNCHRIVCYYYYYYYTLYRRKDASALSHTE